MLSENHPPRLQPCRPVFPGLCSLSIRCPWSKCSRSTEVSTSARRRHCQQYARRRSDVRRLAYSASRTNRRLLEKGVLSVSHQAYTYGYNVLVTQVYIICIIM